MDYYTAYTHAMGYLVHVAELMGIMYAITSTWVQYVLILTNQAHNAGEMVNFGFWDAKFTISGIIGGA